METDQILSSNVLDIIFDGKNKMYGAYHLRTTYNVRLSKALLFTASFAIVISIVSVFVNDRSSKAPSFDFDDHTILSVKEEPLVLRLQSKEVVKKQVNQKKLNVPVIVIDKLVAKDDVLTELTENHVISSQTIEGDSKGQIDPPVEGLESKVFETPETNKGETVLGTVEIEAEFPGGYTQWSRYLKKNLNGNTPLDNGAPAGTYQVVVKFIVSKDGSISDVHPITKHGYGMEEEAVKIIKRGPRWKPALQNGRNVNAYRSQPITFVVDQN